jgi:two-component system, cell cycle sensor histidine kinase and response regulator CckA
VIAKSPDRSEGEKILVVDDEPVVRQFACRVLERAGFRIEGAADGAEALQAVLARPTAYDAVVSDIVMPRLNGVQLMEALSVSHPELPFILMSGYATAQLTERGIAAPCSVLGKPFKAEALVNEVRRCLDRASPGRPTPTVI